METQERPVEMILMLFVDYAQRIDNSVINKKIKSIIPTLGKAEKICKDYAGISKTVYGFNDIEFEQLKLFFGMDGEDYFSGFISSLELENKEKDNLQHFWRHVVLSCYQRQYIDSITKNVKEEADEARSKVNSIYSEFVGILGVFTALSFALMGSVQVFGNILKNINNPTMGNIGYVLVVGGLYLILIYLITMTLFLAMKKVFNKNIKYKFDWAFTFLIVVVSVVLIVIGMLLISLYGHLTC
ncbi:hypothetical protein GTO87_03615 [Ligilactobacillus saerimneri]|uniref:Uncharacterized protein n=1 Tax=Ligilactobacillus saerimneri TaxID=228229 RepID=A0A7H9EJ88_9LACO|nr:hypothetical protein [Ligilactobacillus saerimneri]QLL77768.1 hypothetical protein GTO87_03615 [Ligilactobacillus saerimneri]